MLFDRNNNQRSDGIVSTADSAMPGRPAGTPAAQNIIGNLTAMMFNHNGAFTFNPAAQNIRIVDFQSNGKQILNATANPEGSNTFRGNPLEMDTLSVAPGDEPITFIEQGGVDTGVFGNWDGAHVSNIVTINPAEESALGASLRGQSATFNYNELGGSIVGGFSFGTITMTAANGTWSSGTRIPITLTDNNANTNSKIDQYLNDYDGNVQRITTMKIGTPFSLNSGCPSCLTGAIDPGILVPTIPLPAQNGDGSFTLNLSGISTATDPDNGVDEQFSNRVVPSFVNASSHITIQNTGGILLDTGATMQTLLNTINDPKTTTTAGVATTATTRFHGFNFLNFDLRSLTSLNGANGTDPTAVQIFLLYNTAPPFTSPTTGKPSFINPTSGALAAGTKAISLANDTNMEDFVNLNGTVALPGDTHGGFYTQGVVANGTLVEQRLFGVPSNADIGFMYSFSTSGTVLPLVSTIGGVSTTKNLPMVTDFFSIGIIGDGTNNNQRINNAIYRWELQETSANTGVFTGTTQFLMLNQLNILNPATYAQLRTINHDVLFVAIQDMLQADGNAPQATYLDLGADGVNSQISAQQDIPTHSGTVSFDQTTYKVGDTVTVTVNDPDLNTNNDLVVIYTAVPPQGLVNGAINELVKQDPATDTIGAAGLGLYSDGSAIGRLLDVQWGQADQRWSDANVPTNPNTVACFATESNTATPGAFASSLSASGFSLVETAAGSGIFTGTFEIPDHVCLSGVSTITNGLNIKVNYVDFRDQSGTLVEVSDNAGIRGNTGSVKLDKSVYPVPFGTLSAQIGGANFDPTSDSGNVAKDSSLNGLFPLHRDLSGTGLLLPAPSLLAGVPLVLPAGVVQVHARVNDPDYTVSGSGTNFINVGVWYANSHTGVMNGPVAFQISRQGQSVLLATAGGPAVQGGHILNLNGTQLPALNNTAWSLVADLGPMTEISPGAGIFQANLPIELTDGPPGTDCPAVTNWDQSINGTTGFSTKQTPNGNAGGIGGTIPVQHEGGRFWSPAPSGSNYCVRQGDVLTVTYYDTATASGQPETVTDSATFDLRNGVLQSDKSVYIIGSDMILTLVEPDLNLDSQTAETVPLDLIEWDSHAYKGTMGPLADKQTGQSIFEAFDAKPSTFVETGKDTGIFQAVIKIPEQLETTQLELGEQINLEYTDWGPAGAKTVGSSSQDIELTIYTSNFGATVELDQKVYTWTDMVFITVVAPDHNFDPNLIDTIGLTNEDQVIVSTRGNQIYYKLSETGVDTGIFTGYVILTGDPGLKAASGCNTVGQDCTSGGVDGEGTEPSGLIGTGTPGSCSASNPCGPTNGFLPAEDSDGVSVSFEFTRDQTVTGSALIRWNIGEVSWLQASYPANGQGVLQIVDPDMNLNPKAIDKFDTNVWSDSDSGGIKLTMTETGQDTGIFQGTVYFTTNFQSSGNRLHVSEGDTVTGEYDDLTLPPPYTTADDLRMTATTFIGTVVPPLERAPATNPRIVDSFGNAINGTVKTGQQIQVTADLANGQTTDQPFAYLVQIQDANGVTVSLSWITGTLSAGQSLNPAQSWTPTAAGTYTAQIFVWQSISNPNALSPPLSTTITVQ
jgi:hypothetical protein